MIPVYVGDSVVFVLREGEKDERERERERSKTSNARIPHAVNVWYAIIKHDHFDTVQVLCLFCVCVEFLGHQDIAASQITFPCLSLSQCQ